MANHREEAVGFIRDMGFSILAIGFLGSCVMFSGAALFWTWGVLFG